MNRQTKLTLFAAIVTLLGTPAVGAEFGNLGSFTSGAGLAGRLPGRLPDWTIQCATPTDEQCRDEEYLGTFCGALERGKEDGTCGKVWKQDAAKMNQELPLGLVRVPDNMDSDISEAAKIGVDVKEETFASSFESFTQMRRAEKLARQQGRSQAYDRAYQSKYEANGDEVNSCREYAYEKYYTWNRFQDAAATYDGSTYDAAYDPESGYDIGNMTATNANITSRDGRMRTPAFDRSGEGTAPWKAKNAFVDYIGACKVGRVKECGAKRYAAEQFAAANAAAEERWPSRNFAYFKEIGETLRSDVHRHVPAVLPDGSAMTHGYLDEELNELFETQLRFSDLTTKLEHTALDPTAGSTVARLRKAATEREIADLIKKAEALGCLATGPTPCDWSPRYFEARLSSSISEKMDTDYSECREHLASTTNFSSIKEKELKQRKVNGVVMPPFEVVVPAAPHSPQAVEFSINSEKNFRNWSAIIKRGPVAQQLKSKFKDTMDTDPYGNATMPALSKKKSGQHGNDWFGIAYDFGVEWEIDGLENFCKAHSGFTSSASSKATVFKQDITLFNTKGLVNSERYQFSATVVGKNLFDKKGDVNLNNKKVFNVAKTDQYSASDLAAQLGMSELEYCQTVMIGPVPVEICGGLSGQVGYEFEASSETVGLDGIADCEGGGVALNVRIPDADAFASAYGYLDAGVGISDWLKVGVRGEVTIIEARLANEFNASFGLSQNPENGKDPHVLKLEGGSDFSIRTLDGRIKAYVKVPIYGRYDHVLGDWEGLHWDTNFWKLDEEASYTDIKTVYGK